MIYPAYLTMILIASLWLFVLSHERLSRGFNIVDFIFSCAMAFINVSSVYFLGQALGSWA